ncbi:MAG: Smr/MutS family protein, partial [Brevinema sp.]
IGDSQSLSDELSTFSGHIYNIKDILSTCTPHSLVLIDEIAHATDPIEGEALGCAIIDELIEKNILFMITTHYKKIKIKAFEQKDILTYSTSFNTETLRPEYHLYPDTIGESYALKIASRVGLSSHIVKHAQSLLTEHQDKTDVILSNIEAFEHRLRHKESELNRMAEMLETKKEQLSLVQEELEEQKYRLISDGLAIADKELNKCLFELNAVQRNIEKQPKQSSQVLKNIKEKINEKKSEITERSRKKKTSIKEKDLVFIASLNKKGVIEQIHKRHALVSVGNIKITVSLSDLFEIADHEKFNNRPIIKTSTLTVSHSIDIHGMTADEAIKVVERYLYPAIATGLKEFTIIHGKGTGILQKTVHSLLKNIPEIKDFGFAPPQMGGSGKTIVRFI